MRPPSLLQILIIVLIIVIIFGARRLPDVASSIGKSLKIFKKEVTELREDDDAAPRRGAGTDAQQPYGTQQPSGTNQPGAAPPPATPPPSTPAPGTSGGNGTDQR